MKKAVSNKTTILIIILILFIILSIFLSFLAKKIIIDKKFTKEASAIATSVSVENDIQNVDFNEEDILEVNIKKEEENEIVEEEKNKDENLNNNNNNEKNTEDANKNNVNTTISNSIEYYIRINRTANVLTVYKNDNGNLIPINAFVCSTGAYTPPCNKYPRTQYKLSGNKWEWRKMQGGVYAQYATQVVGNILMHSVPYFQKDPSTLEYLQYDRLGTSASAGCIRLTVRDAKWIYENISSNTIVEFYSSTDPGPLGKPTAQKISSNTECRGWDPTDSNPENPWHTYNAKLAEQEEENEIQSNFNESQDNISDQQENTNNTISIDNNVDNIVNNSLSENINYIENNSIANNEDNGVPNEIDNDVNESLINNTSDISNVISNQIDLNSVTKNENDILIENKTEVENQTIENTNENLDANTTENIL